MCTVWCIWKRLRGEASVGIYRCRTWGRCESLRLGCDRAGHTPGLRRPASSLFPSLGWIFLGQMNSSIVKGEGKINLRQRKYISKFKLRKLRRNQNGHSFYLLNVYELPSLVPWASTRNKRRGSDYEVRLSELNSWHLTSNDLTSLCLSSLICMTEAMLTSTSRNCDAD